MNWLAVSALAAVFGALFVGVSVIGLALQLRQNTHTVRAQALSAALSVHVTQIAQLTQTAAAANPEILAFVKK